MIIIIIEKVSINKIRNITLKNNYELHLFKDGNCKLYSLYWNKYVNTIKNYKGYEMVKFKDLNNKYIYIVIHKLIALNFIPNPNNKPEVNHKDGNKGNNNISNLEWVTASENVIHSFDTNLNKRRYSLEQCIKVKQMINDGILYDNIVNETGVKRAAITAIKQGKHWSCKEMN